MDLTRMDADISPLAGRGLWQVLFTCRDCRVDVMRFVRDDPDEAVRCFGCESSHVHCVSDRLLQLALQDTAL